MSLAEKKKDLCSISDWDKVTKVFLGRHLVEIQDQFINSFLFCFFCFVLLAIHCKTMCTVENETKSIHMPVSCFAFLHAATHQSLLCTLFPNIIIIVYKTILQLPLCTLAPSCFFLNFVFQFFIQKTKLLVQNLSFSQEKVHCNDCFYSRFYRVCVRLRLGLQLGVPISAP